MKKLGLVGGMGPESTLLYYHDIMYGISKQCGEKLYPELTIESVNVFRLLEYCKEKKYDELTAYLAEAICRLEKSGADFAALSANTPHIVFDRLKAQSPIPLISIVEETCEEAARRGFHKVGLLGTIFTMKESFYKLPFEKKGIEVVTPTEDEMYFINSKVESELEVGIVREETLSAFQKIILRMKKQNGIEAIILGCTEIPLLLNDEVSPIPCLDTTQIHVNALVKRILE